MLWIKVEECEHLSHDGIKFILRDHSKGKVGRFNIAHDIIAFDDIACLFVPLDNFVIIAISHVGHANFDFHAVERPIVTLQGRFSVTFGIIGFGLIVNKGYRRCAYFCCDGRCFIVLSIGLLVVTTTAKLFELIGSERRGWSSSSCRSRKHTACCRSKNNPPRKKSMADGEK